jgi:hypothetical protein
LPSVLTVLTAAALSVLIVALLGDSPLSSASTISFAVSPLASPCAVSSYHVTTHTVLAIVDNIVHTV